MRKKKEKKKLRQKKIRYELLLESFVISQCVANPDRHSLLILSSSKTTLQNIDFIEHISSYHEMAAYTQPTQLIFCTPDSLILTVHLILKRCASFLKNQVYLIHPFLKNFQKLKKNGEKDTTIFQKPPKLLKKGNSQKSQKLFKKGES